MYIIVLSKNPNSRSLYCVRMNSAVYCISLKSQNLFNYCDHNPFVHVFEESPRKTAGTKFYKL